jgi:hypothetical protein
LRRTSAIRTRAGLCPAMSERGRSFWRVVRASGAASIGDIQPVRVAVHRGRHARARAPSVKRRFVTIPQHVKKKPPGTVFVCA